MNPAQILLLINGGIQLVSELFPIFQRLQSGGVVTVEEQAKVKAAYDKFVGDGDTMFDQPQWKV